MSSPPIIIASQPAHIYRAFLHPGDLKTWWGCTVVTDARVGGVWVGGWGEAEGGLGQSTVVPAEISRLEPDRLVALKMSGVEIAFHIEADPRGASVRVEQPGADPATEATNLASWVSAVNALKGWVEQAHPYTPPAQPAPATAAPAAPAATSQAPAGVQAAQGVDPYAAAAASGGGPAVVDEGGFGVTDANAVIKSWSKEQGFGYATHAQLGDVVFDYDGCDFEPEPGDKVLLLVIGKRYDGKPKVKRIACPAKGSNIS